MSLQSAVLGTHAMMSWALQSCWLAARPGFPLVKGARHPSDPTILVSDVPGAVVCIDLFRFVQAIGMAPCFVLIWFHGGLID